MENVKIPMANLKITQGRFEGSSHQTRNAYDLAGLNTGIENFFAPFTAEIVYVSVPTSLVLIRNVNEVKTPSGIFAPQTLLISTFHDNDVSDLSVGQILTQGQSYYQEGIYGNATGNHIHMQIATGTYTGGYPLQEISPDVWDLKWTKCNIEAIFYLDPTTNVLDDNGYTFTLVPDPEDPEDPPDPIVDVKTKNYRFLIFKKQTYKFIKVNAD